MKYSPPTNYPLIGYDAPTLADVTAGRKRMIISTKRIAQKTQSPSGHALTITSAPNADAPTNVAFSPSEGNRQLSFSFLITMHTLQITSFGILEHSCRRHERRGHPRGHFPNISDVSGNLLVYLSSF